MYRLETGTIADSSLNASSSQTVSQSGQGTVGTETISFTTLALTPTAGRSATLSAHAGDDEPVVFSLRAALRCGHDGKQNTGGIATYTATII